MKTASISDTKNHLSALLDEVKQGETIIILDRNRPVARLEPATGLHGGEDVGRIARLERVGIVQRATAKPSETILRSKPLKPKGGASVLRALLADREEGR